MATFTTEQIDDIFSYHSPQGDQPTQYALIRNKAKELANVIIANMPSSADQTAAIRLLRQCVMTANASIALDGKF